MSPCLLSPISLSPCLPFTISCLTCTSPSSHIWSPFFLLTPLLYPGHPSPLQTTLAGGRAEAEPQEGRDAAMADPPDLPAVGGPTHSSRGERGQDPCLTSQDSDGAGQDQLCNVEITPTTKLTPGRGNGVEACQSPFQASGRTWGDWWRPPPPWTSHLDCEMPWVQRYRMA